MARIARDQDWVVCHGQTRLVVRRSVECPLRGRVSARICMACRHLVTTSGERLRVRSCAAGDPREPAVPERPQIPAIRCGAMRGPYRGA